jgi:hypothetical protein
MKVIGLMIKQKATESTLIWMVRNIRASGKKINNMDKEKKLGQMVLFMKETIYKGKNMDKDYLDGQTDHSIQDNFTIIT